MLTIMGQLLFVHVGKALPLVLHKFINIIAEQGVISSVSSSGLMIIRNYNLVSCYFIFSVREGGGGRKGVFSSAGIFFFPSGERDFFTAWHKQWGLINQAASQQEFYFWMCG